MTCIHLSEHIHVGLLPSLKDKCPRRNCRAQMSVRPEEHCIVFECPSCGYSARETNSGMRADFENQRAQR